MGNPSILTKIVNYFILLIFVLLAISIIFPILWIMLNGFKTNSQFFLDTWSLPNKWHWENYVTAWNAGVGRYFFNSLFVTSISIILTVFISALASFALSRFDFKGKHLIFILILSGLMLAPQVSLISLFKMLKLLNLYNTYWALILPYVAFQIPFAVFLMRSYFLSLPREVEDAAYIDGCNSFKVFWHVVLPMSKPIIITTALLTGIFFWNEFMFALVFIEDSELRTIPVGLLNLKSHVGTDFGVLLAGLFISTIPVITVFIIFQKYFVRALANGAVKG